MAGKKGRSGRKSWYEEKGRAELLAKAYYDKIDANKLQRKIETGIFAIRDRHLLNAAEGDQGAINGIFSKLHPDKMDIKEDTKLRVDF